MKSCLLVLSLALVTAASAADNLAATILADYQTKAASALGRMNKTLETETTTLAASLARAGDAEGAETLSTQLDQKLAGEPVARPLPAAANLFAQYDAARTKALEPLQKASIARIDTALKSAAGKDIAMVTELGKARAEIEGGTLPSTSEGAADMPRQWTYHLNPDVGSSGTITFEKNGTLELMIIGRKNAEVGKWKRTKTEGSFNLTFGAETFPMTVKGKTAILERPGVGRRYLKVAPKQE